MMKTVITDSRLPSAAQDALRRMGFSVFTLPKDNRLQDALCSHTDMLLFRYGDSVITEGEYYRQNKALLDKIADCTGASFITCKKNFLSIYPSDAILNALVIGDRLFIKSDTAAEEITELCKSAGLKIYTSRQGYPACTVLPLGKAAAITADRGMAGVLETAGVRVTLISDSEKILLPPYEYGFIGGCAGVYRDTVYFIGNLDAHPDSEAIKRAINEVGMRYASLMPDSDSLFDLGGLLFFDERL